MSIFGIILACMFILASICCLPEIVVYLTNRRQSQNLENEKQIEQNTVISNDSQIAKKVIIDDVQCTIIDVNELGEPCAWISDELPLNNEPPYNLCTREYALSLKFNNGWHIPSYDELLKYKQNNICWTTTFYDSMCYYGNPNDKDFKPKRAVRIIKTI